MVGKRLTRLLRGLFSPSELNRELDEELQFHLDMEAAAAERRGVGSDAARRQARVAFRGVERHREASIAVRRSERLLGVARDAAMGWRSLRRSPGFAIAAVATLALGIGASTAAFTVINGVLLSSLPYGDSDRLYVAFEQGPRGGQRPPSYPAVRDWQARTRAFESISYVRGEEFNARTPTGALRLIGGYTSREFFRTMRTPPLLGRSFDETTAETDVVVLSHHAWQGSFGGAPDIVGRPVSTADGTYTVIGVMPPGFRAPLWADAWLPVEALPPTMAYALTERSLHVDAEVYVRLRSTADSATAEQDLERVMVQLAEEYPEGDATWDEASLTLLRDQLLGNTPDAPAAQRPAAQLRILGFAVLLVLLVACVNVASLQLARVMSRKRELAVRRALGAGRGRLVAQLLTENLLLAALGGLLGVALAYGAVRALTRSLPTVLPRLTEVQLDGKALLVAAALTLFSALLSGLLPALRAASPELMSGLRERSRTGHATLRLRAALLVTQIALACVLIVGAGLLLQSLLRVQAQPLGFEPERLLALRVFPPSRFEDAAAAEALYRTLQETVQQVPGVSDVALANHLPLAGGAMPTRVETGRPAPEAGDLALLRSISPEFFRVMGTRVLRGRAFTAADLVGAGGIIVNEAFVRQFLPDEEPLGRSLTVFRNAQGRSFFGEPLTAAIVGVVENERFFDLQGDPPPMVFVPYTAVLWPNTFVVARTRGAPERIVPLLRQAVAAIDPDIPVAGPSPQAQWRPMESYLGQRLATRRLQAGLLIGFGVAALFLALLGVFSVTAYGVALRTPEVGVRMALGARPLGVLRLLLSQALALALVGTALGLVGAIAAMRLLQNQLFGIEAHDVATLATVAALFLATAVLAALPPALRALRISPIVALSTE